MSFTFKQDRSTKEFVPLCTAGVKFKLKPLSVALLGSGISPLDAIIASVDSMEGVNKADGTPVVTSKELVKCFENEAGKRQ